MLAVIISTILGLLAGIALAILVWHSQCPPPIDQEHARMRDLYKWLMESLK